MRQTIPRPPSQLTEPPTRRFRTDEIYDFTKQTPLFFAVNFQVMMFKFSLMLFAAFMCTASRGETAGLPDVSASTTSTQLDTGRHRVGEDLVLDADLIACRAIAPKPSHRGHVRINGHRDEPGQPGRACRGRNIVVVERYFPPELPSWRQP